MPQQLPSGAVPPAGHKVPTSQVVTEVNVVCTSVQHGVPRALARPSKTAKLVQYAHGALAPAQRMVVSLTRLEQLGDAHPLASLVSAWQQLLGLYATVRQAASKSPAARAIGGQIVQHELTVSALARSLGFPACAVPGGAG